MTDDDDDDGDDDVYNIAYDVSISHKITYVHWKALLHDCVEHNSHKYVENLLPCCEWG
jgi:hypothetical protein